MRPLVLALFLNSILAGGARGQDAPPAPLQKFDGNASQTTPAFMVADKWEVRWNAPRNLNISVLAPDGTLVTGAVGLCGALYVPKGGNYHLQIDCPLPENTNNGAPSNGGNNGTTGFQNSLNGGMGGGSNKTPGDNTSPNGSPSPNGAQGQPNQEAYARLMLLLRWQVEVVEMSSAAAQNTASPLPNFNAPQSNGAFFSARSPASPNGAPIPSIKLTEDQTRAVVLIKGDNAEGTGFLIKTPDGPAIVTNIHVIANNPNLKITTNTGALVKTLSMKGASDRDLVMLAVQNANYSCFDMAPDISTVVQSGDEVITPGNSQGGEVMLNTAGKVLGIGPQRVEIDNPIYHGNSGGPVFHTKSGKVLGVVTEAMKVDVSNDLDKASFASRNSAISGSMRYFALRLDTVSTWVPIEARQFQIETSFLDEFHEQSRRLDAFLNSPDKNQSGDSSGEDASKIYLRDEKIMKANDNFVQQASGADTTQRIDALKGFLFDLQCVADLNLVQVQNKNNFYAFDQERAREELDYRKALKAELDSIGNNVERLGRLPRSNN